MTDHRGKIRAAVIIAVFFCLLFAGAGAVYVYAEEIPGIIRVVYAALMFALAIGMIAVLKERIREIRKGETDDLDNY